jgi:hypothetical protein
MAVGFPTKANWAAGDVLTASAQDDLAGTVNLLSNASASTGQYLVSNTAGSSFVYSNNFAAGKNKIINGDMGIWQRGTSFSYTGSGSTLYTADRYTGYINGNGTFTFSQQALTAGAAPVAGYESAYFHRITTSSVGTSTTGGLYTKIEDVRTLAGQTATFSFWAKADSIRTMSLNFDQIFGTGGSSAVSTYTNINWSIGTSWARYTVTFAVPSISGKTIGTGSYIQPWITFSTSAGFTFDTWGWQLEAGSVATAFQTATGTLQGELAACQRYFQIYTGASGAYNYFGNVYNSTSIYQIKHLPVTMRVAPTATLPSTLTNLIIIAGVGNVTPTAVTTDSTTPNAHSFYANGMSALTIGQTASMTAQSVSLSAEL